MVVAVGLIMGTRMWYAMWDAENDDDATFESRMDSLVREIGERGKVLVPEQCHHCAGAHWCRFRYRHRNLPQLPLR